MTAEVVSRGVAEIYDWLSPARIKERAREAIEEIENTPIPEYYPPDVYRAADKASTQCVASYDAPTTKVKNASVGPTNALMRTLQLEFVGPLSQIANLHARVIAPVMDTDLIKSVDAVFSRILKLSPPIDDRRLDEHTRFEREECCKRTANILFSQFKPLLMDLTIFLRRKYSIKTNGEALARLLGCKNSMADSIALLALDRLVKIGPTGAPLLSAY
jgi:hypothetical protein